MWYIKSQAPEYFLVYLEFGKCGCAGFVEPGPRLFSGLFMILKMWVHQVYGTGPRCIFGHCENVDAWVCGEIFLALLDASFYVLTSLEHFSNTNTPI